VSYWGRLTDDELEKRLWEERKKARYAKERRDRVIARSNIEAIIREQTRRYERKFGLV
jgi:hypothetical protein